MNSDPAPHADAGERLQGRRPGGGRRRRRTRAARSPAGPGGGHTRDIHATALIDDGVSDALERARNRPTTPICTRGRCGASATPCSRPAARRGPTATAPRSRSEAIAAVVKVMTRDELSARRARHRHDRRRRISARAFSPTAPATTSDEILFSILEGLAYGCGDVIIGLNPASDDVDTIVRLEQLLEQVVERLRAADALLRAVGHRQADAALRARRASTSASRAWPAPRRRSPAWSGWTSTASPIWRGLRRPATSRPARDPR